MITLEEITFNSMTPWCRQNSDDFLFEELNAGLHQISGHGPGIYFTKLLQIFRKMGIPPVPELQAEWKRFARSEGKQPDALLYTLASHRHPHPKVRFYSSLLSNCVSAEFILVVQDFEEHPDHPYQRHTLKNLCFRLERIISTPNPDMDHNENDLIIIKLTRLAAIMMYLKIIAQYSRHIHTGRLKLTPDVVFEILAGIAMVSRAAGKIAKIMKEAYLPYFLSGPEAYEDDSKRKYTLDNRPHKKSSPEKVNDKPLEADVQKSRPSIEDEKTADRIIGSGEVMKKLGIGPSTLKRYRDNGTVPYSRPNPKGRFFYKSREINEILLTMKKEPEKNS